MKEFVDTTVNKFSEMFEDEVEFEPFLKVVSEI